MAAINIAAAPRMSGFLADAFAGVLGGEMPAQNDRKAAFAAAHILAGYHQTHRSRPECLADVPRISSLGPNACNWPLAMIATLSAAASALGL